MEQYLKIYVEIKREIYKAYIREIEDLRNDGHGPIVYDIQAETKDRITLELKTFYAFAFYELGKRVAYLHYKKLNP